MKIRTALLLIPVLLALCVGSAAAKAPPPKSGVDTSFGRGGKAMTAVPKAKAPEHLQQPLQMATLESGQTYVLDEGLVLAFGPEGRPVSGFGKNGRVRIAAAAGETTEVDGIALDAKGRLLVSGSFNPTPGVPAAVIPANSITLGPVRPSEAFVVRLLPDGERDPTFGGTGEIDLTLTPKSRAFDGVPVANFANPIVYGDRLAVVNGETPVLGGTYSYFVTYCRSQRLSASSFVGAIDPAGPSSQTLASTAYTELPESTVAAFAPMPAGNLAALSDATKGCGVEPPANVPLSVLAFGSTPPPALDPPYPGHPGSLAVDAKGRFLGVEGPGEFAPEGTAPFKKLIRLLPNGEFDPGFGSNGGLPLKKFGEESVNGLVVDAKRRPVVGGTNTEKFLVVRLGTKGKIDHSFGKGGWVEAGFGQGTSAELEAMTTDAKGRILAVGRITSTALKTGVGVGLVRILPGN